MEWNTQIFVPRVRLFQLSMFNSELTLLQDATFHGAVLVLVEVKQILPLSYGIVFAVSEQFEE